MKKLLIMLAVISPVMAIAKPVSNPMFGNNKNQIGLYISQGTDGEGLSNIIWPGSWEIMPFQYYELQYSQPLTIFRLPARVNVHFGYSVGYGEKHGEDWRDYSWPFFGLTWDAALVSWRGFYVGGGLGPYMKSQLDARQDSRFMFGLKVFIGYHVTDNFNLELVTRHFSDGNLTPVNDGYNFAGLYAAWNF